ncbi:hypothetical protein [Desulfonema magnum]|uniref:Uncharacterized protein n=1 Tax=Desulfonema magnum TaxID=45655 RepID=A0A975BW90_9BACT|nr:hypothetical protein [Desulfonema magnum]QTA92911.1 Uncharacterized protein dnm_090040 [Desulfonema magnum]
MVDGITAAGVAAAFVVDIAAGNLNDHAICHIITKIRSGGEPVNHDLQRAVRKSFLSALQRIVSECQRELMKGAERKLPLWPAKCCPQEHRDNMKWLDRKNRELASELV